VSRLVLLGGLVYALFLLGLGFRDGRLLALALPLVAYMAAAAFYAPGEAKLSARRSFGSDRVPAGAVVQVDVEVMNEGAALQEVLIRDRLPSGAELAGGQAMAIISLEPGEVFHLRYSVRVQRGSPSFREIEVESGSLFGLTRWRTLVPAAGRILVLPRADRLRRVPIRPLRTRGYAGPVPARQGGSGVDFFGVREYQTGDPRHWINWRASARHPRSLFTNEYEQERLADVGLILDARQRSDVRLGDAWLFEHAVRAAASLATAFLDDGNRVGLLVYGRSLDWTFPGYGKVQRERILRVLAGAQTGDSQVFDRLDYLPTRFFPTGSQIVLVSPLHGDDLPALVRLRARGYQLLVLRPDPVGMEVEVLRGRPGVELAARVLEVERALLRRRLLQAGIAVVDWHVTEPLDQALRTSLGRVPPWHRHVPLAGRA
jgi:uncharacterized protein (DUF58 family)